MGRFLIGLLFVLIGFGCAYYSKQFRKWFGPIDWAERNIGGTDQLYVLIGFFSMVVGLLIFSGVINVS